MARWHIGCSGFHYKHWKGLYYPEDLPQKKWFEFYNKTFKTLELNVTFYRFPRLPMVKDWYEKSSPDFIFSVKAPKGITHYKQFINCEQLLSDFYGVVQEGLKEKLGCILFQMPPRMKYTEERLERIISSLDLSFQNVLEFTNESWWNAEVYKILGKHKIAFSGQSHPLLPGDVIQNTKFVYYRFHGVPELYRSRYSKKTLQNITTELNENEKVKEVFVYFNNDSLGWATTNAVEMKSFLKRKSALL